MTTTTDRQVVGIEKTRCHIKLSVSCLFLSTLYLPRNIDKNISLTKILQHKTFTFYMCHVE